MRGAEYTATMEQDKRKLFNWNFWSPRQAGDTCGMFRGCDENLECTRVSLRKQVCAPKQCVMDAYIDEFDSKSNLASYGDMILSKAGLLDNGNLYNQTTLARMEPLGRDGLTEENAQYLLNGDAREKIIAAMRESPLDMTGFMNKTEECASRAAFRGIAGYGGFVLEAELGASFHTAFYFAIGTSDSSGGLYSDLCFGLGPTASIQVGGLGGFAITDTRNDFPGISIFFDGDIAAAIGIGLSAGIVFPSFAPRFEMSLSTGVGGGIGGSICYTTEVSGI